MTKEVAHDFMRKTWLNKSGKIFHQRRGLVALLLVYSCIYVAPATAEESSFVFGVFPRKGFTRTIESFTPLAEYLSSQLGRTVIIKSGRNFAEFWQGIEQRQYDLVHYNQYHYVRSRKQFSYDVIAKNEENHQSTIRGVLVVRKDNDINSLEDLRGHKIIFGGGRHAMQSYIVASYLLQQAGLMQKDYDFAFAESPPNAIYAMYYRQAMAAGSADANLELPLVKNRIETSQLKVLARGESLAHLPWAVKNELTQDLKERLTKILISLQTSETGKKILNRAALTAILPAIDEEYDAHRKIIKLVLDEDY